MNCSLNNKQKTSIYSWSSEVFGVAKAGAQGIETKSDIVQNNISNNKTNELPLPVLALLLFFVVFMFILSAVYLYHWVNFNMGDTFIKKAIYIYFIGLALLSLPLILFLI